MHDVVEVLHGVVEDGEAHVERRPAGVLVRARAHRVERVHVRGPVVGLDQLVHEEERGAGGERRQRGGRKEEEEEEEKGKNLEEEIFAKRLVQIFVLTNFLAHMFF